uniref:Uncharacterized protein n=1 Tax=Lygus hesperus TaxID=30085 RepID=A0A146L3E1_LYGHE
MAIASNIGCNTHSDQFSVFTKANGAPPPPLMPHILYQTHFGDSSHVTGNKITNSNNSVGSAQVHTPTTISPASLSSFYGCISPEQFVKTPNQNMITRDDCVY